MAHDCDERVWRTKDGRAWRIGDTAELAWILERTTSGVTISCTIPPVFEAYATLELPGTGEHAQTSTAEDPERHDAAVLAVLREHAAVQSWWLGYLDTGSADVIFDDAPKVKNNADWSYVLIEAGPEQASSWREDDRFKGVLPDLIFPTDHSWLLSTLWDDDWSCFGGSQLLIDALLAHPDLRHRAREVTTSDEDVTPPGHTAI